MTLPDVEMDLFWNAGARDTIQGVDLLGLRQLDQDVEQPWVAGITTRSSRARYLSLLTWAIAEHYRRTLAAGDGRASLDWGALGPMFGRLEFIALAATALADDGNGDDSNAIGKNLWKDKLQALRDDQSVDLADLASFTLSATHFGPCRSFGLVQDGASAERPVQIPPRGQRLHAARSAATGRTRLTRVIFAGGVVHRADFDDEGHHFDLNGLIHPEAAAERVALVDALRGPLSATMAWIFRNLLDAPQSPWKLLEATYGRYTVGTADPAPIDRAIGELMLRRRVHYALELLLSATTRTLVQLGGAPLAAVVASWRDTSFSPGSALADDTAVSAWDLADPLAAFADRVGQHAFSAGRVWAGDCTAAQQALYALALLVACERQSRTPRAAGRLLDRGAAMEQVFAALAGSVARPLSAALIDLLRTQVVARHLDVTLGKMGRGQGCSLRFYPEGASLQPLWIDVRPGFSGLRLPNVFAMLADLGLIIWSDGSYSVTEDGLRLHAELA